MRRCVTTLCAAKAKPLPSERLTAKGTPFESVSREVAAIRTHIHSLVTKPQNDILDHAAKYVLASPGKLLRPALVTLMAHATLPEATLAKIDRSQPITNLDDLDANPLGRHLRLAEVTELIHTASLVHDDVIDHSDVRRGRPALHIELDSTKLAVLAGDFLLARASYWIATLGSAEVVILMTQALEDLSNGEIMQHQGCFDIKSYTEKSYCKTAALIDRSLSSAAVLSEPNKPAYANAAKEYGKCLGIAFQIVDDCLDVTGSEEQLGKPKLNDLKEGVATLPVLLAAEKDSMLKDVIRRKFTQEGDVERAVNGIHQYNTVPEALAIADAYCKSAINALDALHESPARKALKDAVEVILTRQA